MCILEQTKAAKWPAAAERLADLLESLAADQPETWFAESEKDGWANVRYHTKDISGVPVTVEVSSYVTPELAELLCALHNNLPTIIKALREAQP